MRSSILAAIFAAVASTLLHSNMAEAVALPVTLTNVHIVSMNARYYGFYINMDATLTSCTQTSSVWVGVDPTVTAAEYRDIVSSLQLAYTLGRPVTLYLLSCSGGGATGIPLTTMVDVN